MAEFTSATDAPAARAVIYATGFDHDIKLINLFHNGEVHDVATVSFSAASVAAPVISRIDAEAVGERVKSEERRYITT
jgi:hypothetical protein